MADTPPERTIAVLLNDTSRLLRKRFDLRARRLGLTRAQWRVMAYLRRLEGINQRALAEILELENITLARHIDRLEKMGLVERRRDPSDRRAWNLYLDTKARPIIDRLNVIQIQTHDEGLVGLTKEEIATLIATLKRIKDNLADDSAVLASLAADDKDG